MKKIQRKSMLYKTGVEYGDYTMNHVFGCSHGCKFPCYAFLMAKRFGKVKTYEEWLSPSIVSNTLELLDKEIPKLKSRISSVQLCFTTDPFMNGYEEIREMSLLAINKLNAAGIKCVILTKGILPIELAEFSKENEYGITLISLDENYREKVEPGAICYSKRIEALYQLHKAGCKTWISMEPYPTPNLIEQDLLEILNHISFVDKIIFGRMNYNKESTNYQNKKKFYEEQVKILINYCQENQIEYYIKSKTLTSL